MPKIKYSAIVNQISGRLSGSVFSTHRGTAYLKNHRRAQRQPRTADIQKSRGVLSTVAGKWHGLPAELKALWESWASAAPLPMSGFNAHNSLNLVLLRYLSPAHYRQSPPPHPLPVPFPLDFRVIPSGAGSLCLCWTSPALSTVFVLAQYWIMPGRADRSIKRWSFGLTAASAEGRALLSLDFPSDYRVDIRLRCFDLFGRLGPWAAPSASWSPRPAKYGFGSYGLDHYNH